MHQVVHLFQKLDRLQILASAKSIGNPLPLFAGVVQIEHRGHGIHPQPVEVIAVEPG